MYPDTNSQWFDPFPTQNISIPFSWSQLTEGCASLEQDVKRGLQGVLGEFFTETGEIEQNNYNLTDLFSNNNMLSQGEPLLRQ